MRSSRSGERASRTERPLVAGLRSAVLCLALVACASTGGPPPRIALLAAFPAELAALLEHARIDEVRHVDGHAVHLGRMAGVPVLLAMTRIGPVNATRTTRLVLDRFEVRGVIVSGVAGTPGRIGDVDVPAGWALEGGEPHAVDARWLEIARALASTALPLERCTQVRIDGAERRVCVPHAPTVRVGGVGRTSDPFGGTALACDPVGDDVSGCDVSPALAGRRPPYDPRAMQPLETTWNDTVDMESAAIGHEARARGLPWIAFRAGSDGAGDPLGLPGFPAQFYAYYWLAARNAAAATAAFVGRLAEP